MSYSVLNLRSIRTISGSLVILFVVACTNGQNYEHQINGNEKYLKAPSLRVLNSPSGVTLPLQNDSYKIPDVSRNGAVGKDLDIWPPR